MTILLSMNLGFAWGNSDTTVVGPYCVAAQQTYQAGQAASEVFRAGDAASEVYTAGATASEVCT